MYEESCSRVHPFHFLVGSYWASTIPIHLTELSSKPGEQEKLQFGQWNIDVFGCYLWEHHWGPWAAGPLHKWKQCGPDQPDPGKFDRVLPGTMSWKSGMDQILVI